MQFFELAYYRRRALQPATTVYAQITISGQMDFTPRLRDSVSQCAKLFRRFARRGSETRRLGDYANLAFTPTSPSCIIGGFD